MKNFLRIFGGISIIVVIGVVIYLVQVYREISSDTDKIVHYNPPIATQIFDRKGRLIANLFDKEFRFYAKFEVAHKIVSLFTK